VHFETVPVNHTCSLHLLCILKKQKKVAQGLMKALAVTHTGVLVQLCYPDSASLLLQIMFFVPLLILLLL